MRRIFAMTAVALALSLNLVAPIPAGPVTDRVECGSPNVRITASECEATD